MAATKLANMPYIVRGEPDVYETVGTGDRENAPGVQYDMSENENIERFNINASDSYAQFKGKGVPVAQADFSDSVARNRSHGYATNGKQVDYEAEGEGLLDETLQERFERIQKEVRALEDDYRTLSAQQKREGTFIPETADDFAGVIGELKIRMANIEMAKQTKSQKQRDGSHSSLPEAADASHSRLQNQSDIFGADPAQVISLDARIKKLEQAFGSEWDLNSLALDTSDSLLATVTMLKSQMSLLNKENLDQIESRMQHFLPKLTQAVDKLNQAHSADGEIDKKIFEAHAMLKGWTNTFDKVQVVVDRLIALKAVHEQASSCIQLQQDVGRLQKHLVSKMEELEKNMQNSRDTFTQAIATITRDIGQLESRPK